MTQLKFYPLGNADSTFITFADDRLMLKDYCQCKNPADDSDKRIDLASALKTELRSKGRNDFDVVAFSHCDNDHVCGAEDFFWLDHAQKYQSKERPKIKFLWVPACFILEKGLDGSARVIREEAKHRLLKGSGIRVFGNPGVLDDWLTENKVNPTSRKHLITHAGECVPGFTKDAGSAEIFVHSPFSYRMEGEDVDRNGSCIVLHITFYEQDIPTRVILGADAEHEAWCNMVYKTEQRSRENRLNWDVFRISHHCSYTALSADKGSDITLPDKLIAKLFNRGSQGCLIISSSDPIPDKDTKQPPHKQAAAYYKKVVRERVGKDFLVTMATPSTDSPKPIVIDITPQGAIFRKITGFNVGAPAIVSAASPRQGR